MRPEGSLRLGMTLHVKRQVARASAISASAPCPFRKSPTAPRFIWGCANPSSFTSGATARAVTTSAFSDSASARALWTSAGKPNSPTTASRNRHFLAWLSTRRTRASGRPFNRIASTSPGKPAPAPISTQVRAAGASASSCAESKACRGQNSARLPALTRFIRSFQSASIVRSRSRSAMASLLAPVAAAKLAASRTSGASSSAADMGEQGGKRAGGDPFDSGRLAEGGGAHGRQPFARLVGKPAHHAVVEARRQGQSLVAAERFYVGVLPGEVAGVGRIDLDLLADLSRPVG